MSKHQREDRPIGSSPGVKRQRSPSITSDVLTVLQQEKGLLKDVLNSPALLNETLTKILRTVPSEASDVPKELAPEDGNYPPKEVFVPLVNENLQHEWTSPNIDPNYYSYGGNLVGMGHVTPLPNAGVIQPPLYNAGYYPPTLSPSPFIPQRKLSKQVREALHQLLPQDNPNKLPNPSFHPFQGESGFYSVPSSPVKRRRSMDATRRMSIDWQPCVQEPFSPASTISSSCTTPSSCYSEPLEGVFCENSLPRTGSFMSEASEPECNSPSDFDEELIPTLTANDTGRVVQEIGKHVNLGTLPFTLEDGQYDIVDPSTFLQ